MVAASKGSDPLPAVTGEALCVPRPAALTRPGGTQGGLGAPSLVSVSPLTFNLTLR